MKNVNRPFIPGRAGAKYTMKITESPLACLGGRNGVCVWRGGGGVRLTSIGRETATYLRGEIRGKMLRLCRGDKDIQLFTQGVRRPEPLVYKRKE